MKKTLLIIVSCLCLLSCTEIIDVSHSKDTEPMLVVDALLTTKTEKFCVKLSKSTQFDNGTASFEMVSGAHIRISDGKTATELTENTEDGYYYTEKDYTAFPGIQYTLQIDCELNGTLRHYESSCEMPQLGATLSFVDYYIDNKPIICLWGADNQDLISNLSLTFDINGYGYPYRSWNLLDHTTYEEGAKLIAAGLLKYNGWFYDGGPTEELKPGDIINVQFYSLSDDFQTFISGIQEEVGGMRIPIISPQPANVPSNISNGALGCFALAAVSEASVTVSSLTRTKEEMLASHPFPSSN